METIHWTFPKTVPKSFLPLINIWGKKDICIQCHLIYSFHVHIEQSLKLQSGANLLSSMVDLERGEVLICAGHHHKICFRIVGPKELLWRIKITSPILEKTYILSFIHSSFPCLDAINCSQSRRLDLTEAGFILVLNLIDLT